MYNGKIPQAWREGRAYRGPDFPAEIPEEWRHGRAGHSAISGAAIEGLFERFMAVAGRIGHLSLIGRTPERQPIAEPQSRFSQALDKRVKRHPRRAIRRMLATISDRSSACCDGSFQDGLRLASRARKSHSPRSTAAGAARLGRSVVAGEPEYQARIALLKRGCPFFRNRRRYVSRHTTLGDRNQRRPPSHFAVVNSARSSSGKVKRRNQVSDTDLAAPRIRCVHDMGPLNYPDSIIRQT